MCDDVKFSVMSSLFSWMQRSKSTALKRAKFRKFIDIYCKPGDYFSAIRLLLPSFDRERGSYGLQESALATCLIDALGMSRDSPDAVRLINWRKGGAKTGANAGNFANVAAEILQRRQGMTSGGLTVKELNELLDRLASSENRAEKTSILGELIRKTNAQEMKWIIMILLKDLKVGVSEKSIFQEFHPDAEELFNVTCDLRLVCEKLCDRSQRHKRQDIEVGKAVRPQSAKRAANAADAWKKLHGKEIVVECKFDGIRIQIHKNGSDIHYYSRNYIDHPEYAHAMSNIIMENILVDRCILDGEMLVWDKSANRFAEFGSNQEIAKAAREGLDSDCQERHDLLQKVVKPLKNSFEILVPNGGLNNNRTSGEPCWSLLARSLSDVERFFKETIENREEGVVLKDLGSKWDPDDRSEKWLKLKPDYIRAGSDLDVLIIGGYYGSGRHGGEVAQFLVGLAEKPAPNTYPRKVGTGLSDDELNELVSKLKPYFSLVTTFVAERVAFRSVILTITSDIRTIRSEVFAAPYSLRFPRIDRIRYDKPWHECLDIQSFIELVNSSNGTTQRTMDQDGLQEEKRKRHKPSKRGDKNKFSVVPSHFIQTDISNFVNVPPKFSLDMLHKMVIENGGTFSMNLSGAVTHCIAAESKGIKYAAAKRHGDVIHCSWFLDCCSANKLIRLQTKYFSFLSDSSRKRLEDEIDEFSDSYFWDLNVDEFKQILGSVKEWEDVRKIDYCKRKYCPSNKWSRFHGCCIYFHIIVPHASKDWEYILKLSLGRMKVELSFGGGRVSENLSRATHVVVLLAPGHDVDIQRLLESFSDKEKHVLHKKRLLIVRSQWFEDCLNEDQKLPEAPYSLKPGSLEESTLGEHYDEDSDTSSSHVKEEKPPSPIPVIKDDQQSLLPSRKKRGRPAGSGINKRKQDVIQPRRTRPRIAHRPAKIGGSGEHDTSFSDDEDREEEEEDMIESTRQYKVPASTSVEDPKTMELDMVEDLDLSSKNVGEKAEKQTVTGDEWKPSYHIDAVENPECSKVEDGIGKKDLLNMEVMFDPVHSFLMDMIPSLRKEGVKSASPSEAKEEVSSVPKPPPVIDLNPNLSPSPNPNPNPGPVPGKKKKVSYKDLAEKLLKD
ncbi:hypothetical protein V2J09_010103 [Rumex salicifolius]